MSATPDNSWNELSIGGRNLVVCCDGTSNQFSEDRAKAAKLCHILSKDRYRQIIYYHPGVGIKAPPGLVTGLGAKMRSSPGWLSGTD